MSVAQSTAENATLARTQPIRGRAGWHDVLIPRGGSGRLTAPRGTELRAITAQTRESGVPMRASGRDETSSTMMAVAMT